jgi:hypothetical protein
MRVLALLLLLSGCSTTGLTDIVQTDLPRSKLYDVCEPRKHVSFTLYGCKSAAFNRCYIYILSESEHPSREEYLDTVAHERRHCIEGRFH